MEIVTWNTVQEVKASCPSVEGVKHVLTEGAQQPPTWQSPKHGRAPAAPLLGRIRVCLWQGSHTDSLMRCCQMFLQQRKLLAVELNYNAGTSSHFLEWLVWVSKETLWPWLHQDHISPKGDFTEVPFGLVFLTSAAVISCGPATLLRSHTLSHFPWLPSFEKPWSASTIWMIRKETVAKVYNFCFVNSAVSGKLVVPCSVKKKKIFHRGSSSTRVRM